MTSVFVKMESGSKNKPPASPDQSSLSLYLQIAKKHIAATPSVDGQLKGRKITLVCLLLTFSYFEGVGTLVLVITT